MRAQTIAQLAWYKPISDEVLEQADTLPDTGVATERVAHIVHYAECHKNLQFGWEFALEVTKDPNFIFPAILQSPINCGVIAMLGGLVIVPVVSLISPKISESTADEMFSCYNAQVVVSAKKSLGE